MRSSGESNSATGTPAKTAWHGPVCWSPVRSTTRCWSWPPTSPPPTESAIRSTSRPTSVRSSPSPSVTVSAPTSRAASRRARPSRLEGRSPRGRAASTSRRPCWGTSRTICASHARRYSALCSACFPTTRRRRRSRSLTTPRTGCTAPCSRPTGTMRQRWHGD